MRNNNNVTVISNDCWSYFMHQEMELKYNTPFVDVWISNPNYLNILRHLFEIDFHNIKEVNKELFTTNGGVITPSDYKTFPVVNLDDVAIIQAIHYRSFTEFKSKWHRRVDRMNFHKLLIKFSDYDGELNEFQSLNLSDPKIVYAQSEVDLGENSLVLVRPNFDDGVDDRFIKTDVEDFINNL